NLVGNATKFTRHGQLDVVLQVRDAMVELQVNDDGPGIPLHFHATIFEPFEQGDAAVQREHGGTGLGLAISRRLARDMGGDLTLRSEVDEGASFTLRFPISLASQGAVKGRAAG
ncbi:MAG: ATP-binding protein, partial [Myxococcota bacterium]